MSAAATATNQPGQDAATLLRRWFEEVWNQGNEAAIDQLLAEDATMWGVTRPDISSKGSGEFKKFYHAMRTQFPDLNIAVDHVVQEGDTAFARWTVTSTNAASAPTSKNRQLRIVGMSCCRARNGIIVEGWNVWDQIGLARQTGALEGPAATMFP
jgi:predicted ester cyclase